MIMGIISLIFLIIGFLLIFYGNDEGYLLFLSLGIILTCLGVFGIIAFIGINLDIIINWFSLER